MCRQNSYDVACEWVLWKSLCAILTPWFLWQAAGLWNAVTFVTLECFVFFCLQKAICSILHFVYITGCVTTLFTFSVMKPFFFFFQRKGHSTCCSSLEEHLLKKLIAITMVVFSRYYDINILHKTVVMTKHLWTSRVSRLSLDYKFNFTAFFQSVFQLSLALRLQHRLSKKITLSVPFIY